MSNADTWDHSTQLSPRLIQCMDLAARLRADGRRANERRVLVLAGSPEQTREQATDALAAADIEPVEARYVGPADTLPAGHLDRTRTNQLLGTTQQAVVIDCHDACEPNAIGRAAGAVDGGGLLVLLTPPLDSWPNRRDEFDATLAVKPFDRQQVIGYFRRRLVWTLRQHRGIAIVDVDTGTVESDGIVDGPPRRPKQSPTAPDTHDFPVAAYDACLTQDQSDTVASFERLRDDGRALVVEADRGRGKSSAAGLAAASLALEGTDVLVTAPQYQNTAPLFERASELLTNLGELAGRDEEENPSVLETETGRIRYCKPAAAAGLPDNPDCVIVDEAAALPVRLLEQFLRADCIAFTTTIHGYEGAGRGFSVRFRDRLADGDHDVSDVSMTDPIRYGPADPVEVWAFRALCLDARPAVDPLVADAQPETVSYRRFSAADLVDDEHLLREVFGLLVVAHYRTEPNDLARMLDAPNVTVRGLVHDGHVVSVVLLAREGDLPADLRARMYEGERVRGNMIPDVLTSQLRDEAAADPVGWRVLRIATHSAVRSRGLGSQLLDEIRGEFADSVDWLGVGYGATPELLHFWDANSFSTVHLSTTRNDRSGEHSAVMLDPLSEAGEALHDRHARWLRERLPSTLGDSLADLDPDIVRAVLDSVDTSVPLDLSDWEWRVAVGLTTGLAILDTDPEPAARLTLRQLIDPADPDALTDRQERLLVLKALQHRPWSAVAEHLGVQPVSECKRSLPDAVRPLVEAYGNDAARSELERFE